MRSPPIKLDPEKSLNIGLSWEQSPHVPGEWDYDLACLAIGSDGCVIDACFYHRVNILDDNICHSGDAKSSSGGMGKESILINSFTCLPTSINSLIFCVTRPNREIDHVVYDTAKLSVEACYQNQQEQSQPIIAPLPLGSHALHYPTTAPRNVSLVSTVAICCRDVPGAQASGWSFYINMVPAIQLNTENIKNNKNWVSIDPLHQPIFESILTSVRDLIALDLDQINIVSKEPQAIRFSKDFLSVIRPEYRGIGPNLIDGSDFFPITPHHLSFSMTWKKYDNIDLEMGCICLDKDGNVVKVVDFVENSVRSPLSEESIIIGPCVDCPGVYFYEENQRDKSLQSISIYPNGHTTAGTTTEKGIPPLDQSIDAIFLIGSIYYAGERDKKQWCLEHQGRSESETPPKVESWNQTTDTKFELSEANPIFSRCFTIVDAQCGVQGTQCDGLANRSALFAVVYRDYAADATVCYG